MLASTCLCVLDCQGEILFVSQGWRALFADSMSSPLSKLEPGMRLAEFGDLPSYDPAALIRLGVDAVLKKQRNQLNFEFSDFLGSQKKERLLRVEITSLQTQEGGCQITAKDASDRGLSDKNASFFAELEKLISESSLRLATSTSDQMDENIRLSLQEVSLIAGVHYAFISKFHKDAESGNDVSSMTHFWHPAPPQGFYERFQKLPLSENPHRESLLMNESVVLHRTEELPEKFRSYRERCEAMNAKSVVSVPLFVDGLCYGYVGFVTTIEHRVWTEREVMVLRVLSEIFGRAFSRQRIEEVLHEREKSLLSFYRESQDPAWCFTYPTPIPIHLSVDKQYEMLIKSYVSDCNDAAAKLVGLSSRAELIGMKSQELFGISGKSYSEMFKRFIQDDYRSIDARVETAQRDGSTRVWVHQAQGVVQDGKLLRSWVTTRDITELESAEDVASRQNAYRNSSLTDSEIREYVADIEKVMKAEQPYLDPSFNLSKLSKLIRVPDYQISQILNMGMKTSFYDLINRYRIEHLVTLLSNPAHDSESILDLAYQVGFNSKSTFNIAFKKITGKTPSTYRTQIQLSRPRSL